MRWEEEIDWAIRDLLGGFVRGALLCGSALVALFVAVAILLGLLA